MLATTLGTLAALGHFAARFPGRRLVMALLISPMIVPIVIVAVGSYLFFGKFGLTNTRTGLVLAHTALATPFVVITVTATLSTYDTNLTRAALQPRRVAVLDLLPRDPAEHHARRAVRAPSSPSPPRSTKWSSRCS